MKIVFKKSFVKQYKKLESGKRNRISILIFMVLKGMHA